MAKKMLRKQRIAIQKLEERVLFDAAGAAEIVDAAAAAAAVQGAEAEAQADDADDEKSSEVIAPPENVVENNGAEAEAEAEENAEAGKGAESEIIDSTELAEELADAVEDIEVEDLDDISPEDVADDIEVESDDIDVESDEVVAFADAFAVPEVETPEVEERELVIISDYVKDADKIAEQLDENTDVLILKQGENPMDQINEYLDSQDGVKYDAIHVVSHGNAGYFLLNDSIVDAEAVAEDPASWKAIGEHLTADGDIMIYGCNVAGSDDGKAMIANIAELTGADVAASVDKVGVVNGWDLEFTYGVVDTQNIVIEGGNFSLNNYQVIEYGATKYENWVNNITQANADGDYYFISNGSITDADGNVIESGALAKITVKVTAATETEPEKIERNYARVEGGYGTFEWALRQSYLNIGDDLITISKDNVVDENITANLNVTGGYLAYDAMINDAEGNLGGRGGITINAAGVDVTFNSSSSEIRVDGIVKITARDVTFNKTVHVSTFSTDHLNAPDLTVVANDITFAQDIWTNSNITLEASSIVNSANPSGAPDYGDIVVHGGVTFYYYDPSFTADNISIGGDVLIQGADVDFITNQQHLNGQNNGVFAVGGAFTVQTGIKSMWIPATGLEWDESVEANVTVYADEAHFGGDFTVISHDYATEHTPDEARNPVVTVNITGIEGGTEDVVAETLTFGGAITVTSELGGKAILNLESEQDPFLTGIRDNIVAPVEGNVTISKDSELIINYGLRVSNPNTQGGQFQLWAKGNNFTNEGFIHGNGSLRITNSGKNNTLGDGTVNMTNGGGVYYDFVIANYTDLENTVYVGNYDVLTVNFGNNNISLNEAFFKPRTGAQGEALGRTVGTFEIAGSGVITMTGTYAGINTTIDVDWDGTILHGLTNTSAPATAEVEYVESGVQYVLGGNYYTLEVGTSMNKILAGSISVGIDPEALVEVAGEPEASMAYLNKLRVNEWYAGSMILGTTLYTEGFDVTFYGQTVKQTGRDAQIYGTSGTVTYIASAVNDGGNNRVFYGGTYGNLTIGAAPARDIPYVGPTDADALDFTIDQDVTIYGTLTAAAAAPVQFTKLHDFTVEVTGAVKNITGIVARDANLHFRGNVTGNITAIGAQRTEAFLAKTDDKVDIPVENINGYADRQLTFAYGNMDVRAMIFDGYQVTFGEDVNIGALKTVTATDANVNFNNTFRPVSGSGVNLTSLTANRSKTDDGLWINFNNAIGGIGTVTANGYSLNFVENAGTIGTLNLGYVTIAGVNYVSDVTFADGVNLTTAVNIEGGDITSGLLHTIDFSGETSGNAVVDSYLGRSIITYNYDGDQTVFRGRYHDLVINGSGVKTINAGTGERDRVFVGGTLDANNAEINVAAGIFEFSAFDPAMTPTISINAGAQMIFGKASTDIVEFNGDIINAGTLTFEGQIHVTGDVTILENGTMSVDASAIGSIFDLVNNYGSLTLSNNNITIVELHNYNDLKVTDISVKLNVYNHSTGKINFDLEATEQGNTFTFNKGQEDTYVQDGDNRLINGGTITVSRGTLALNKFTQGDRVVAEDGSTSWTYDNMQYNIAAGATLIFAATNVNNGIPLTGASAAPGDGAYLGNITNAGVFRVTAANAVFNGTVNNASGSRLETGNTGVTFNGDFIHAGTVALAAGAASDAAAITFNGNVSGAGKVAYDGTITYAGAEGKTQRILDGTYSNTVTIKGAGEKTVAGNVIFNSNVKLSSTIGGENGSVTFNGVTEGVEIDGVETFGEFTDALTVTYGETANKIYGGTYGNLTLNSNGRTVTDTFTAETLTLKGNAEITSEITVTDKIVLGENSATIFNGTITGADAVITGGKNGTVEFRSTTITGITVDALEAAASYTNDSSDAQQILSGTYNNGIELTGTEKVIAGNVTVVGALVSTASALNLTENGASLKVTGTVAVDAISIAAGTTLNLILADGAEHNRLGTVDGSGLVTLGGTLNVTEKADNNGYLDIYGWVDEGTAGKINVNGGVVEFMGTIADYGAVTAYVTNSGGSIIDDNSRLQNLWVTITGDNVFTSQLKDYSASSKFMILAGAQLTVDSFIWTDPVSGNLVITDEVVAFQLVGDAKLIFAMDDVYAANAGDKTITVHNLILDNSGESKVIVNAGSTVVIDTQADFYGEGAISGNGNVTMSNAATYAGNGTFNMTGGKVVYGSNAFVYGGTYYDLTLNRNTVSTALEVTNAAVFSAAVTFADGADVTLSGTAHFRASATLENGAVLTFNENVQSTFSDSKIGEDILSGEKGSTVIYEANAGVLQGTYGDLVLNGDHDIDSNFIVRGDADFTSGIQSGSGDWEFRGNATGEINNEGTVTYSSISKIYGLTGTYNNLVADAANLYLAGITLNGTLSGKGTLTFEGENTYGDAAVADMVDGSVVTYAIGATNVLKGNYANFKLLSNDNGDEIKLTNGDLTVRELAEIKEGVTFGATSVDPATITFAGTTKGNGTVNFTADTTAVYGVNAAVFGGNYHNLNIADAHEINNDINVAGNADFGAEMTGSGMWVFNGTATGLGSVKNTSTVTYGENFSGNTFGGSYNDVVINSTSGAETTGFDVGGTMSGTGKLTVNGEITGSGSAAMDDESTVTYTDGMTVFNGSYSNLILDNNTTVNSEVTVNALATLNGTTVVADNGVLTFAGTTNAKTGGEIDAQDYSKVQYNGTADVFAAKDGYFDLTLYGERAAENAIDKSFSVNGHADITGTQILGDGVTLTFNGSTNADEVGVVLVLAEGAANTVIYNAGAAVYGGTYYNLTVNGNHTINKDIIVNNTTTFTGVQSGSGMWTFNGTAAGTGSVNNTSSVTYGENFTGNTFGGSYNDIIINSAAAATDGFDVAGTMSGTGKLTVNGEITGSGSAAMDDGSVVEYASGLNVFNGSYSDLTLNGNTIGIDTVVTVRGFAELKGEQLVSANGTIDFAGTTNAKAGVGSLKLEDGSTVKYNGTADLFANDAYYNLTLYGERSDDTVISNSFTVNGKADITGTQILGDGIEIVFNGTTNANDVDAEVLVLADGAKNTIIYAQTAAVFGGTYYNLTVNGNHTINRNINVNGEAKFNGLQSGSGDWVFNGTVSGTGSVDNTGNVTYNTAVTGFGGSYNNINANADVTFASKVSVKGILTGAADVTVTFNAVADGTGSIAMADGSTVIYKAAGSKLLGGNYANLQLDAAGTAASAFVVTGKATLNAVLTVNAGTNIIFGGTTNAAELLDGENARINGADGSTVAYADGAAVFQGRYATLSLADGNLADGEMGYASNKDNGNITITGNLMLASAGKLSGNFSFTLLGSAVNVESIEQTAGTVTYGSGASIIAGTYANFTLKGGADASGTLNYEMLGDVTVNGLSTIENFAVLKGKSGQTLRFLGTTNAADRNLSTPDALVMAADSTVEYALSAEVYNGSYGNFKLVATDGDVLVSNLKAVTITGSFKLDIADGYYLVFDEAVAADKAGFYLTLVAEGDIWYTNAYLAGSKGQIIGTFYYGDIRIGGDYNAAHDYINAYTGEVTLNKDVRLSDHNIDVNAVAGKITLENPAFVNVKLVTGRTDLSAEYINGHILEVATLDGKASAYHTLTINSTGDSRIAVDAGTSVKVSDNLIFRKDGALLIDGNFQLGSAEKYASATVEQAGTNYITVTSEQTEGEIAAFYLKDGSILPALDNSSTGIVNIYAEDNVTIASGGVAFFNPEDEKILVTADISVYTQSGITNITAGDNFTADGMVYVAGGVLNLTAGNNAQFKGSAFNATEEGEDAGLNDGVYSIHISGGETTFDLGDNAVIYKNIYAIAGETTLNADSAKFKGETLNVTGGAVFNMNLGKDASAATSTIASDVSISGTKTVFNLGGYNNSIAGTVQVTGGAAMVVTGSNIGFTNEVTNAAVGNGYRWNTSTGRYEYLASDAELYEIYGSKNPPSVLTGADYPGTITIDSDGAVSFTGRVVSGGDFAIEKGEVTFSREFAVSDGTFAINGGKVFFENDVYVSAVYGNGSGTARETLLYIGGTANVTMAGSLYNWVRIPIGYNGTADTPVKQYGGPFSKDAQNKIHLAATLNSSHIYIGGDAKVSVVENIANIGVWGDVFFTVADKAEVTVGGNFANYSHAVSNFWSGNNVRYDYLTNLMGFKTGFGSHPLKPDYMPGADSSGAYVFLEGDSKIQIEGETLNGATYHGGDNGAWKDTGNFEAKGWSHFSIDSANNVFKGKFSNASFLTVNSAGNTFGDVDNSYFMEVHDSNSFGTITNTHELRITNAGAVVLTLVNEGADAQTYITGNADGMTLVSGTGDYGLTVKGGIVSIQSDLNMPINGILVTNDGKLEITAQNDIEGKVQIGGEDGAGTFNLLGAAGGTTVKGDVTIADNGKFHISTTGDAVEFTGNIANANEFIVDGSISVTGKISNSGKLTISKTSEISGTLDNAAAGNVLVGASAAGSVFNSVVNAGNFTNSANDVSYKTFANSGTFINDKGVTGVNFSTALTNSGTMKIDGEISATGTFVNAAAGNVYVYGLADFGKTTNSGAIYLEPLTEAHAATVKFGDLTHTGTITSKNDTRNAADIYFKGKTEGNGNINGFTGTLYYVYTGKEPITQTFYDNSNYDQVTVYVGNKSVTGLDYTNGLVTLNKNITFKNLYLDGGNLAIGDAVSNITLDASKFTEINAGTITVNAGSTLKFSKADDTTFASSIANYGLVDSAANLILLGETSGNGLVNIASGKSITYAHNGSGEQVLWGFADGSSTNLIVEGSTKAIAVDMNIAKLTNNGADITVKGGATLSLGKVDGTAAGVDGFTVSTEKDAVLAVIAGTFNAKVNNAGTLEAENAVFAGSVSNSGTVNADGSTFNGAVANSGTVNADGSNFNGAVDNNGTFTAVDTVLASVSNTGTFNVNANVAWNALSNAGTLNINVDTVIGSKNATTNTGKINVGGTLTVDTAAAFGGTVNVNDGAALKVTGNGAAFETVVNQGLVEVTGNGEMTIAGLNNGEQGAASTLKASGNGVANITESVNAQGDSLDTIYGKVVKVENGIINFGGKIDTMGVSVDGGKLSDVENSLANDVNNLEITVDGEDASFIIDKDSDEKFNYTVSNGAELVIDANADGVKNDGEQIDVKGDIVADDKSTVTAIDDANISGEADDKVKFDANVGAGEGTITVDNADINVGDNAGNIVIGDNVSAEKINNGSNGNITVDGDLTADSISNAGNMTNNGDLTADSISNSGDFVNNGDLTADSISSSGDFVNNANLTVDAFANSGSYTDSGIADVDTFDNSGDATVSGSGSSYGIVDNRLGANFTLNGSGNNIDRMNNTGMFSFSTRNNVDSLNNFDLGLVYRDGVMWMMASDEGMSPEFFSDGHNSNFTALAHMPSLLDADRLDADLAARFSRLAPGKVADLAGEGHAVDLHALLGGELDFIGIESEVDELLHGEAPELDEEELADVLSEGEEFSDGFDVALSEIVSE